MPRRVIVPLIALVVLGGGAFAAYSLFVPASAPDPVEQPNFTPTTQPLPETDEFARLAQTDPLQMYEACLSRYAKESKAGIRAILEKHERVHGKLHDPEVIRIAVAGEVPAQPGAEPHVRVRMIWEQGCQKDFLGNEVRATLYAAGENSNNLVAWRPTASFFKAKEVGPRDGMARDASRYCITDTGLYRGMLRTYMAWKPHRDAGDLHTEYLGKQPVEKAGGRVCHIIRRTCVRPEVDPFVIGGSSPTGHEDRDGTAEVTVMIDAERWLQVGSVLKQKSGDLLGEYYFRDVEFVDTFPPDTFTVTGLKANGGK